LLILRRHLNNRGYIGPLGDDFPSIFPLLFGLIIFFSSLYAAYNIYQAKDSTVQVMKANIMISRAVRSQIYFDGEYWKYACKLGLAMRSNYQVHLAMWLEYKPVQSSSSSSPSSAISGEDLRLVTYSSGGSWPSSGQSAICPKDRDFWGGSVPNTPSKLSEKIAEMTLNREAATMTYPVVYVDRNGYDNPARLVVVTWR
jgi:hypothetical protein